MKLDEENNDSTYEFPSTDLNSPYILENETATQQKEDKFEDFFNTTDNFRENSVDDKISNGITLEKKEDFTAIDQHALSVFNFYIVFINHVILFIQVNKFCLLTRCEILKKHFVGFRHPKK